MGMHDLHAAYTLIDRHPNLNHFRGRQSEAKIRGAETALGCLFPPTYRDFLRRLGGGGFGSVPFQYLSGRRYPDTTDEDLVGYVLRCRTDLGDPDYIISVCVPDFLLRACLDLRYVDEGGEMPIVHWASFYTRPRKRHRRLAPDFGRFLLAKVRGAIALRTIVDADLKARRSREGGGSTFET